MKFKSRQSHNSGWSKHTIARRTRQLRMPQFPSTFAGERAADAVYARCGIFKMMKRINKMPKRGVLSGGTLQQLFGGSTLSSVD